jgi:uncharacterized membrane protein
MAVASPLLVFHIGAAATGLFSGAAALLFRKGSRLHRTSGNVFFISMLGMSASATYMAVTKPAMISIVPGILTFYLVATAWATVIRKEGETGLFEFGALLVALSAGTCGLILGWEPAHRLNGLDKDGFPAAAWRYERLEAATDTRSTSPLPWGATVTRRKDFAEMRRLIEAHVKRDVGNRTL